MRVVHVDKGLAREERIWHQLVDKHRMVSIVLYRVLNAHRQRDALLEHEECEDHCDKYKFTFVLVWLRDTRIYVIQ